MYPDRFAIQHKHTGEFYYYNPKDKNWSKEPRRIYDKKTVKRILKQYFHPSYVHKYLKIVKINIEIEDLQDKDLKEFDEYIIKNIFKEI